MEEMGRNGSSGLCSTWHYLAGDNFAVVKCFQCFLVILKENASAVVTGLGISPKSSPQNGNPWLQLLEGQTRPCPGKSCSAGSCTGAAPHTARTGQELCFLGLPQPLRLLEPCPRHLLSSAQGFWVACSLLGRVPPSCSLAVSHFLVLLGTLQVNLPQLVIPEPSHHRLEAFRQGSARFLL